MNIKTYDCFGTEDVAIMHIGRWLIRDKRKVVEMLYILANAENVSNTV